MALLVMMKRVNNSNGFTLLELLIVVAIIGIVGVIATPNILSWTNSRSIQTDVNELVSRIQYVRAKAISEGRQFKLKTDNPASGNTLIVRKLSGSDADIPTNDDSDCVWGKSATQPDEYAETYTFSSTVKTRHNKDSDGGTRVFKAAPLDNNKYKKNQGTLCFNSDGTTTTGGFLLERTNPWLADDHPMKTEKYRIDVFKAGFFSVERYVPNSNCTVPNCWAEAD